MAIDHLHVLGDIFDRGPSAKLISPITALLWNLLAHKTPYIMTTFSWLENQWPKSWHGA